MNKTIRFSYLRCVAPGLRYSPASGCVTLDAAGQFISCQFFLNFNRTSEFSSVQELSDAIIEMTLAAASPAPFKFRHIIFDDAQELDRLLVVLEKMKERLAAIGEALRWSNCFSYSVSKGWESDADEKNNRTIKTLRGQISKSIRKHTTSKFLRELIGCSIQELRAHLEKSFQLGRDIAYEYYPDMTWENYGTVWHVDHIRPCADFNLADPEEQKKCFHWSNLQPLFAADNQSKGKQKDW